MLERYALPMAFESEELATLLMGLNPKQRRVLREYVDRVEQGDLSLAAWLADPKCPVTARSWYTGGARAAYRNSVAFQNALAAYLRAAIKAGTNEETKAIASSRRILRLGAVQAANRLVHETEHGERSADRIKAAAEILDRADMETASKSEVDLLGERFEDALRRAYGAAEAT